MYVFFYIRITKKMERKNEKNSLDYNSNYTL